MSALSRDKLTAPTDPVRARAAANPWWDFILYILPRLTQLTLLLGPDIYNSAGNNYQVDYQAGLATYTIRATTWPDIPLAHQFLTWNTGRVGVNQITPNRNPIQIANGSIAYTAAVFHGNDIMRSLSVNVTVQPVSLA